MFKKILIGLAVIVAAFIVVVSMQPSEFRVERSEVIAAPPAIVHSQVDDFRNWKEWSPWAKMDPDAKVTLSENPVGEGATYAWEGKKTGAGEMRIAISVPARVDMDLKFTKPFKAENKVSFAFAPIHGGTRLTWAMTGKNNFVGKAACLFMNMDKTVGGDFAKGLTEIKHRSEVASGWRKE
jgi:hypothetical protein